METRTVWVVNYHGPSGRPGKYEAFCETQQQARKLFRNGYKAKSGYEIDSILDWREDLINERRK